MLELGTKGWLLAAAGAMSVAGMAWLALAMDVHWQQVRGGEAPSRATVLQLRMLGGAALLASLLACLLADHATMAALTWVMLLTTSALSIAFALAWRPPVLAPLAAWIPRRGQSQ
jgi:hypothetical protein